MACLVDICNKPRVFRRRFSLQVFPGKIDIFFFPNESQSFQPSSVRLQRRWFVGWFLVFAFILRFLQSRQAVISAKPRLCGTLRSLLRERLDLWVGHTFISLTAWTGMFVGCWFRRLCSSTEAISHKEESLLCKENFLAAGETTRRVYKSWIHAADRVCSVLWCDRRFNFGLHMQCKMN